MENFSLLVNFVAVVMGSFCVVSTNICIIIRLLFQFSHLVAELLLLRLLQLPHGIITESKSIHAATIHLLFLVFLNCFRGKFNIYWIGFTKFCQKICTKLSRMKSIFISCNLSGRLQARDFFVGSIHTEHKNWWTLFRKALQVLNN